MLPQEIKRLLGDNLQAGTQLVARTGGVLRQAGQVARDPQRRRAGETRALVGELVRAQIDYLQQLTHNSARYLGAVAERADQALAPQGARASAASVKATALQGALGQTAAFEFQLDNPNDQPVHATIEADAWQAHSGAVVAADSLTFEPAATVVAPRSATVVRGSVRIDERFAAGQTYATVVRVAGFAGHHVALRLRVVGADGG